MGDDAPRDPRPANSPPADDSELALWERFLAHQTTAADDAQVRAWSLSPGRIGPSAESVRRSVWEANVPAGAPPAVDPQAMLDGLRSRLHVDRHAPARGQSAPGRAARRVRRVAAAMAWATAAVVTIVASTNPGAGAIRSIHLGLLDTGTYRTGPDERLHVRFVDGTEIAAAPNTSVRIVGPSDHRSIYVAGEAYVDADGDAAQPVVVHAANALVQNAGARFDVRTDTDAKEVRIAVATGVVLAGDSGAPWQSGRILTHGTLGVVSARGVTRAFRPTDPGDALVWGGGGLRFDPERLRDALPRMTRKDG